MVIVKPASRLAVIVAMALTASGTILSACGGSARDPENEAFERLFPIEDVNSSLVLQPIDPAMRFRIGVPMSFRLENLATEAIVFPPGFGASGFAYIQETGEWIELPNVVDFPDVEMGLGPRGEESPHIAVVDFSADEAPPDGTSRVRVVVQGWFLADGGEPGDTVAAYADLPLH